VCTAIMWREIELTHTTDGRLGNPYECDRPDQELHCQGKRGERSREETWFWGYVAENTLKMR